jgi:hypothetical protein
MRMGLALVMLMVGLGLVVVALPVQAHHAFAATFDTTKPVKATDGTMTNWGFEGGSPNSLIRHGVTKNTIPVGTELIIQGYQSKAFEHKGVGVNMTFPDGRKFLFGGSAPGAEGEVATPTKDEIAPATKDDTSKK